MKPQEITTKVFLDSANPEETRHAIEALGFLDGQTTNPSLLAKNPDVQKYLAMGKKFTKTEVKAQYKNIVQEISRLLPQGDISVEVFADASTSDQQMLEDAREMYAWIPNAVIKFPINAEGLKAAHEAAYEDMRVNMTLCFSQVQAAAVYAATLGAQSTVYVSPFIGRLDDKGLKGTDVIANILQMYASSDHHVQVLASSIRSFEHLAEVLHMKTDAVTVPFGVLKEWSTHLLALDAKQTNTQLAAIPFENVSLEQGYQAFHIEHEMTEQGIEKFTQDLNSIMES